MKSTTTNESLVMTIRGLGHVPAFKNKKIIAGKRLITAPKARKWMEECTKVLYLKLKSMFQTDADATSMGHWQQFATLSWPSDDCWQQIPQVKVRVKVVPKGEEGATIKLTKISPTLGE